MSETELKNLMLKDRTPKEDAQLFVLSVNFLKVKGKDITPTMESLYNNLDVHLLHIKNNSFGKQFHEREVKRIIQESVVFDLVVKNVLDLIKDEDIGKRYY